MLAMDYRGPCRVRATHIPDPCIEHPEDAIVRVLRSCICGSDLHLYHGLVPDTRIGTTVGHEFVGEVVDIGSGVQRLKVGDRVLVPFSVFCGSCYFCQRELFGNCHDTDPQATAVGGIYGYSHTAGGYDGGQAQFVRVPRSGAGPIGIFAAKSAWLFSAGRGIVVDHVEERLAFVKDYAQCEVLNFRSVVDMAINLKRMTDGLGPDVCIDAVGCEAEGSALQTLTGVKMKLQGGSATALHWAINSVRKGGNVQIVGVYERNARAWCSRCSPMKLAMK